jgi:hypothetical protein
MRQALGPNQMPQMNAQLYLYLLVGSHQADLKKVIGAFNAYLCEVPSRSDGPSSGKVGLYIVPVLTDVNAYRGYAGGEAKRLSDEYDYRRAHQMLLALVKNGTLRSRDLITTGIYFAALDRPIPERASNYAIFEISRLRTERNVQDWLVTEQQLIELGQQQTSPTTSELHPSPLMILEGLGETVAQFIRISTPANAETIPCK